MNLPQVVSQDEWLAARKELLAREKEATRDGGLHAPEVHASLRRFRMAHRRRYGRHPTRRALDRNLHWMSSIARNTEGSIDEALSSLNRCRPRLRLAAEPGAIL